MTKPPIHLWRTGEVLLVLGGWGISFYAFELAVYESISSQRVSQSCTSEFSSGHKTHQWTKAPGSWGSKKMQTGHRGFKLTVQDRVAIHLVYRGYQFLRKKPVFCDIDFVSRAH